MGLLAEQLTALCRDDAYASWRAFFESEAARADFAALDAAVTARAAAGEVIYPPARQIFAAFAAPADGLRAVILGQDPYYAHAGEAMGLAFSVPQGVKCPPSLRNILRELRDDTGLDCTQRTDLTPWVRQGVLLLNTALTVTAGQPMSHARLGWQGFVRRALTYACGTAPAPFAAVLWGRPAQSCRAVFAERRGLLILESPHPSPLSASRGFFGSRPFTKINDFLQKNGCPPVDWRL